MAVQLFNANCTADSRQSTLGVGKLGRSKLDLGIAMSVEVNRGLGGELGRGS